jgi:hypothetical protein
MFRAVSNWSVVRYKLFRAQLARLRAAAAPIPPLVFEQVCFFGGLASIAYGAGLMYRPLGFIVGGLFAFWLATLISGERHGPQ